MYRSTKTYGHNLGLSAVFRQHKANSHCNKLHGYALAFRFEFEATELDDRNWVVDFGDLKALKAMLEDTFDHKTVVAATDPELAFFQTMREHGLIDIMVTNAVGCEAFAKLAWEYADHVLKTQGYKPRVRVASVECMEHGANSAIYHNPG